MDFSEDISARISTDSVSVAVASSKKNISLCSTCYQSSCGIQLNSEALASFL